MFEDGTRNFNEYQVKLVPFTRYLFIHRHYREKVKG